MDLNPILNTASLMGTVWLVLRLEQQGRRLVVVEKRLGIVPEEEEGFQKRLVEATEALLEQEKLLERAKDPTRTI